MKKFLIGISLIALAACATVGWWGWNEYQSFLQSPITNSEQPPLTIVVPKGGNFYTMVRQLEQSGITKVDWRWKVFGKLEQPAIKAGEYQFLPIMTPVDWVQQLIDHKVVQHQVTIVEGLTTREILEKLDQHPLLEFSEDDLLTLHERLKTSELYQQAQQQVLENELDSAIILEGLFLPETYSFLRDESAIDVLERAHHALIDALQSAWQSKREGLQTISNPYELLTLASIIEKETAAPEERQQIAGVFHRRLQKNMLLQTDPTVIYGIEDYDGNIRRNHLTTDTPYNTYTRSGLTPTPIALASAQSILAAAQPAEGDSLYFVALGDGSGRHAFSRTLQEHNQAVRTYLKNLRGNRTEGQPDA